MATTIMVSETTKQMLDAVKEEEHMESFDALIRNILQSREPVPRSMFGKGRGKGLQWKKEYRMDLDEHHLRC